MAYTGNWSKHQLSITLCYFFPISFIRIQKVTNTERYVQDWLFSAQNWTYQGQISTLSVANPQPKYKSNLQKSSNRWTTEYVNNTQYFGISKY